MEGNEGSPIIESGNVEESRFPLVRLFYNNTTKQEKALFLLGSLCALAMGCGIPLLSTVAGDMGARFSEITKAINNASLDKKELEQSFAEFNEAMERDILLHVVLGIWATTMGAVQASCFLYVGEKASSRLRKRLIAKLLHLGAPHFDAHPVGSMSSLLYENIERMQEGMGDKIGMALKFCTEFLLGLVIAYYYDAKLAFYLSAIAPFMLFSGLLKNKIIARSARKQSELYALAYSTCSQAIGNIKTVYSLNGQGQELRKYGSILKQAEKYGSRCSTLFGLLQGADFFFYYFFFSFSFYIGANLVSNDEISVVSFFTVFYALSYGTFAMGLGWPHVIAISTARGASESILKTLENQTDDEETYLVQSYPNTYLTPHVKFRNVHFTYPTRPSAVVLKGISFEVLPGKTTAIVGASGSGKSTIFQLLLRFYKKNMGNITIDDTDIESVDVKFLRKYIGIVSQEPILFDTTIEENLRFGCENASNEEIRQSLQKSNAIGFVDKFPMGLQTIIGERGAQLSGGQKQRLAIARVLLRKPKILLLDEATSALDVRNEKIVQSALDQATQGLTTLIVAHRLSTVRYADSILVLQDGQQSQALIVQIVECGKHDDLIKNQGAYCKLVEAQELIGEVQRESDPDVDFADLEETVYVQTPDVEVEKNDLKRMRRELAKEHAKRASLWQIFQHCKSDFWLVILGISCCSALSFCNPIHSILVANVIEAFSMENEGTLMSIRVWSLCFLALGVFQFVTWTGQCVTFGMVAERFSNRLRLKTFSKLLQVKCSFFDWPTNSSLRICTRLSADASNAKLALDYRFGSVITTIVSILAGISVAFYYSWQMAVFAISTFPVMFYIKHKFAKFLEGSTITDVTSLEKCNRLIAEALESIKAVKSLNMENRLVQMSEDVFETTRRSLVKKALIQGFLFGFSSSAFYFLYAMSFRFGTYLILSRLVYPVNIYKVLFAISLVTNNSATATSYIPDYIKATYAAGLIFKLIATTETDKEKQTGFSQIRKGKVNFEAVRFSYLQRPDSLVLDGVTFTVNPGKTIALVGTSGCGKSSILSLLERFYSPNTGSVELDNVNIEHTLYSHLRNEVALVSQEPVLFSCSIRENLTYGLDHEVDNAQIEDALRLANAHEFVNALPQGLETIVGDRGSQLSGGQKQGIAIARAVIRRPQVLLLDEATSALDSASEKLVQNALDAASKHFTTIIVAHRLSTIVSADQIVIIDNGQIMESGTHETLVERRGAYWKLIQSQLT